jgi:hypothetical protein
VYAGTLYCVAALRQRLPHLFSYDADASPMSPPPLPDLLSPRGLTLPAPMVAAPLFAPQLLRAHAHVDIDRHLFESLCLESARQATCTQDACLETSSQQARE